MKKRPLRALTMLAFTITTLLGGCKLVKNSDIENASKKSSDSSFANHSFDPASMVKQLWTPKILPYINKKAIDFTVLLPAIQKDADVAGKQYGYHEKGEDAAWNFVTIIEGPILETAPDGVAPALRIDTNGDGKADVEIQIGPIFTGTSLRDSLDFISFTRFDNQIDFAKFASALNDHVYATVLSNKITGDTKGRQVKVTGTFTYDSAADMPSVVPVDFAWKTSK